MPHLFSHYYGLLSFFQLLKVIRNFCHHWGIKHHFSILDTPGFLPLRPVRFILRMRSAVGPWALSVSCCFSIEADCTRVFSSDRTDVGLLAAWLPQNLIWHDQAAVSAQSKLTFPQTQISPSSASCGVPLLSFYFSPRHPPPHFSFFV